MAVDTLGHLLTLHVTPADEQDREQVARLAEKVQEVTDESVRLACVNQGYTGGGPCGGRSRARSAPRGHEAARGEEGFVLLPRRWVIERSFGWMACFRRLARDYERLPETLAGLHYLAFAIITLGRLAELLVQSA